MLEKQKIKNVLKKNKYVYQVAKSVKERVKEWDQASVLKGGAKASSLASLQRGELEKINLSSLKKEDKMKVLHVLMRFKNFHSAAKICQSLDFDKLALEEKNVVIQSYLSSTLGVRGDYLLGCMVRDFDITKYGRKSLSGLLSNIQLSGMSLSEKSKVWNILKANVSESSNAIERKEQLLWQAFFLSSKEKGEIDPLDYFGRKGLKKKGIEEKRRLIPYLYQSGHLGLGASFLEEVTNYYGVFSKQAFSLNLTYRPLWLNEQSFELRDLDEEFVVSSSTLKGAYSARDKFDSADVIFQEGVNKVQQRFRKANNFVRDEILYLLMDVDEFEIALDLISDQALPDTMLSHLNVLGYSYLKKEDFISAKDCFELVFQENPADSVAEVGLRLALPRTGESMLSILDYRNKYGHGEKNHGRTGRHHDGSDLTISLLMSGDYVNGLYSKRHGRHWKSLKRYFGQKFLNYEKISANGVEGKKLFVIGDDGVGDEIRTAQFYQYLSNVFGKVSITCDPRLKNLLDNSFGDIDFIPVERYRKGVREKNEKVAKRLHGFDKKIVDYLTYDCLGVMEKSDAITCGQNLFFNRFINEIPASVGNGYLDPICPPLLGKHPTKIRVGILWRSHFKTTWRKFMYLDVEDFFPLTRMEGVDLWSIQHAIDENELEYCRNNNINIAEGVDLFNDFDGLSSYLASFDLLVGISSAPIELGAALGIPVWMLGFSPENYYLRTASGKTEVDQLTCNSTIIAPPWIDFTASQEECCKLVFSEVCERLKKLVAEKNDGINHEVSGQLLQGVK